MNNTHDVYIEGKYVNLREVQLEDAEFILKLRCDEKKSKHIHKTENNLEKQTEYLKHYKTLDKEWYFIIENKEHESLGTIRIYGVKNTQFTAGSWLMLGSSSPSEVIEGPLLLREYAFNVLNFEKDFFDVRKTNKKVIRFHKITGAKLVAENDMNYFFEYTNEDYRNNKEYLYKMLE